MSFIPGVFYAFVVSSYLLAAPIGFNLNWPVAYGAAGVLSVIYIVLVIRACRLRRAFAESQESPAYEVISEED